MHAQSLNLEAQKLSELQMVASIIRDVAGHENLALAPLQMLCLALGKIILRKEGRVGHINGIRRAQIRLKINSDTGYYLNGEVVESTRNDAIYEARYVRIPEK